MKANPAAPEVPGRAGRGRARAYARGGAWPLSVLALLGAMLAAQLGSLAAMYWLTTEPGFGLRLATHAALSVGAVALVLALGGTGLDARLQRVAARPRLAAGLLALLALAPGVPYAYLRQYSIIDEAFSYRTARLLAENGYASFFRDYAQIPWLGNQHPPLPALLYGSAMRLLNFELTELRLISLAFVVGILLLTLAIGSVLFDRTTGLLAALCLAAMPAMLRLGTMAMTDIPLTFFCLGAVYLAARLHEEPSYRRAVFLGVTAGTGLLTKYLMVLMGPVVLALLALRGRTAPWRHVALAMAVALVLLGAWLGFAYRLGVLAAQTATAGAYSGSFVAAGSGWGAEFLVKNVVYTLPRYYGLHMLPLMLLGLHALAPRREPADRFLLLWALLFALPVLLTLPDARYFVPIFPVAALVCARGLQRLQRGQGAAVLLALLFCGLALHLWLTHIPFTGFPLDAEPPA